MASRTITAIRKEARSLKIPRYSVMKRGELLKAVQKEKANVTEMDILRHLPPELGGLVLQGLEEEELRPIRKEKGVSAAKAAARKACCLQTNGGLQCFALALTGSRYGAACSNLCAKQLAAYIVAAEAEKFGSLLRGVIDLEEKATLTSDIEMAVPKSYLETELRVSVPKSFIKTLSSARYSKEYTVYLSVPNKSAIRELEEINRIVAKVRTMVPSAAKYLNIWQASPQLWEQKMKPEVMKALTIDDTFVSFQLTTNVTAHPPVTIAKIALAYPKAFDYLAAIEAKYGKRSTRC